MLVIKMLGQGCAKCSKMEQVARQGLEPFDVEAAIVKATDYAKIRQYPIESAPVAVINEKVMADGSVPAQAEIIAWLTNTVAQPSA